eukprot:TRINITY_DN416_c0_g1_i1.p1 TRINITY_DN416_c0_g1~~TRINITY_DN416_c0_g1_i1.p1  ORF type:complete len:1319 (+),score=366.00 TRINITY_DN416_c0_g1_i1:197-4153(+)
MLKKDEEKKKKKIKRASTIVPAAGDDPARPKKPKKKKSGDDEGSATLKKKKKKKETDDGTLKKTKKKTPRSSGGRDGSSDATRTRAATDASSVGAAAPSANPALRSRELTHSLIGKSRAAAHQAVKEKPVDNTPEGILEAIKTGDVLDALQRLNTALNDSTQDAEKYVTRFVTAKGVPVLLGVLQEKNAKRRKNGLDVSVQVEALKAIDFFLGIPRGQKELSSVDTMREIMNTFASEDTPLKTSVLRILSLFCLSSDKASEMVLDAATNFRRTAKERKRFESVVDALSKETNTEFLERGMEYINAVTNSPSAIEKRMAIRGELNELKLPSIIEQLMTTWGAVNDEIRTQLEVYLEEWEHDKEEIAAANAAAGPAAHSVEGIFEAVKQGVRGTPNEERLLATFQTINEITNTNSTGGTDAWKGLEKVVKAYYLMMDKEGFDENVTVVSETAMEDLKDLHQTKIQSLNRQLQEVKSDAELKDKELQEIQQKLKAEEQARFKSSLTDQMSGDDSKVQKAREDREKQEQEERSRELNLNLTLGGTGGGDSKELKEKLEAETSKTHAVQAKLSEAEAKIKAAETRTKELEAQLAEALAKAASGASAGPPPPGPGAPPPPAPMAPPPPPGAPAPPPAPGGAPPPPAPMAPPPPPGAPAPPPAPPGAPGPPPPPPGAGAPPPPPGPPGPPPPPGMGGPPPPPGPPGPPPPPGMGGPPPPPGMGGPPPPPGMGGPPPPMGMPAMPSGPALKPKPVITPSCKMKQFNWAKIPDTKVLSSYWKDTDDQAVKIDSSELEAMFSAKVIEKAAPTEGEEKKKDTGPVSLLDPKTANNGAIMLSRFKMSFPELKNALLALDENVISAEGVTSLTAFVPSKDEIQMIVDYPEDKTKLGKTEQYYWEIRDLPRLQQRLNTFKFKLLFDEQYGDLKPDVEAVLRATKEVEKSPKFKQVLEIVLALGNYLNGNTFRGRAYGFKLDGLTKLRDTKAADGQTTLLHYLVQLVESKYPDAVDFPKELRHVPRAARVVLSVVQSTVGQLNAGMKSVEAEIPQVDSTDPKDKYKEVMTEFVDKKKPLVTDIEASEKTMEEEFKRVAGSFGEPPDTTPDQFFGTINSFLTGFEQATIDIKKRKEKEAKEAEKKATTPRRSGPAGPAGAGPAPPGAGGAAPMGDVVNQLKAGSFFRNRRENAKKTGEDGAAAAAPAPGAKAAGPRLGGPAGGPAGPGGGGPGAALLAARAQGGFGQRGSVPGGPAGGQAGGPARGPVPSLGFKLNVPQQKSPSTSPAASPRAGTDNAAAVSPRTADSSASSSATNSAAASPAASPRPGAPDTK